MTPLRDNFLIRLFYNSLTPSGFSHINHLKGRLLGQARRAGIFITIALVSIASYLQFIESLECYNGDAASG